MKNQKLFTADEIIRHLDDVAFGMPVNGIRSKAMVEGLEVAKNVIRIYADPDRVKLNVIREYIGTLEVGFGKDAAYKVACNMLDAEGLDNYNAAIFQNDNKLGVTFNL